MDVPGQSSALCSRASVSRSSPTSVTARFPDVLSQPRWSLMAKSRRYGSVRGSGLLITITSRLCLPQRSSGWRGMPRSVALARVRRLFLR